MPLHYFPLPAVDNLEFLGSRPTETVQSEYPGEGILAAGDVRHTRWEAPYIVDGNMLEKIEKGSVRLFIHGVIYYEDCWGNEQTYPFTLSWNPNLKTFADYREKEYKKDQKKANPS